MAPAHDAMTAAGCRWGVSWDLEVPLYFAPQEFEKPTLKRSNAHDIVAAECAAIRTGAGLLDISGFSRFEVSGPNATAWLDHLMASKLPGAGRARLAPMLAETGKLKGDLTVLNWGDGRYWVMGSYYLRAWHMRWFDAHMPDGVTVRDLGEEVCGFAVIGPKSQAVLAALNPDAAALPFMGCGRFDIGLIRAHVARMSVTGETGFEINCRIGDHIALRRLLLDAGASAGIRECGFNAMLSTRLEKSFGIWSREFTQGYTPAMTGMDRWIDWNKGFVGKAAALAERDGNGTALSVHVVGAERAARVVAASPYDPQGRAMRG